MLLLLLGAYRPPGTTEHNYMICPRGYDVLHGSQAAMYDIAISALYDDAQAHIALLANEHPAIAQELQRLNAQFWITHIVDLIEPILGDASE
jgi:hypothetical protein